MALVAPFAGLAAGTARPMLWQLAADFRFRMPKGYVITRRHQAEAENLPLLRRMKRILEDKPTATLTAQSLRAFRSATSFD